MSAFSKPTALMITLAVVGGSAVSLPSAQARYFDEFGSTRIERRLPVTTVSHRPLYGRPVYEEDDFGYEPRRCFLPEKHLCGPGYHRRPFRPAQHFHPVYGRPLYSRPVFDDSQDCRVIIKKRVNHWGDLVIKRVHVCD